MRRLESYGLMGVRFYDPAWPNAKTPGEREAFMIASRGHAAAPAGRYRAIDLGPTQCLSTEPPPEPSPEMILRCASAEEVRRAERLAVGVLRKRVTARQVIATSTRRELEVLNAVICDVIAKVDPPKRRARTSRPTVRKRRPRFGVREYADVAKRKVRDRRRMRDQVWEVR